MATKKKANVVELPPRRKIGDYAMAWARTPKAKRAAAEGFPFVLPQHPPQATPTKRLAMDAQPSTNYMSWAAGIAMSSAFNEGLTFLGYPYLAELAQRPEYRRVSETVATEMTRKWIKLVSAGDQDKTEQIEQLEDFLDKLRAKDVFRQAAEQDGFFGRGHIYLDTGDTDNPDELKMPIGDGKSTLSKAKINRKHPLRGLRTVEAVWCYPLNYNSNDPLRSDWYRPNVWFVLGKEIHSSRLMTLIGREVPDLLKPAYSFGGLSLSQMMKPYVDNWLRTRQSVSDLIHSFSVLGIKTQMDALLGPGHEEDLQRKVDFFNMARDNHGLMLLNKDTEEFWNIAVPLSTLDALQAQSQEHMAAIAGIPLVKFLGIQPMGLNASSEGEIRVWYDWIAAYQEALFSNALDRLLNFAQLSIFGVVDPDIGYQFESLWALDEAAAANVRKVEADTDIELIDAGVLDPKESRKRIANDPDTPYASLDAEMMPPPPGGMPGGPDDPEMQAAMQPPEPGGGKTLQQARREIAAPQREVARGQQGLQQQQALQRKTAANDAGFKESDHPRGQPENKGEFASSPGGGGSPHHQAKPHRQVKPGGGQFLAKTGKIFGYIDPKYGKLIEQLPAEVKEKIASPEFHHLADKALAQKPTLEAGTKPSPKRAAFEQNIIAKLESTHGYANPPPKIANTPVGYNHRADLIIGYAGAGKSGRIADPLVKQTHGILCDSDELKVGLPEFKGGDGTHAVQEEGTYMWKHMMKQVAATGANIVAPFGGSRISEVKERAQLLHNMGYVVHLHFLDMPWHQALGRTVDRYGRTGKFTDPAVLLSAANKIEPVYALAKAAGIADSFHRYTRDDSGKKPKVIHHDD